MPRWPVGYVARKKQTCPSCGKRKDFYADVCRACCQYKKPLLGVAGENHPAWKGGVRIDRDGYIRTYDPNHPWPRRGGYVLEHVRLMELLIGRRIRRGEVVHHKDGNKLNNNTSNLELLLASDHSRLHRLADTPSRQRDLSGRFARKEVPHA
jgi:hypothetical protein